MGESSNINPVVDPTWVSVFQIISAIDQDAASQLRDDLAAIGIDGHVSQVIQASADPPQWVSLLNYATWLKGTFEVAASIYMGQLAKCAADDTWKNRKEIVAATVKKCGNGIAQIKQFVQAFIRISKSSPNRVIHASVQCGVIKFRIDMKDEDTAIDTVARTAHLFDYVVRAAESITDRVRGPSTLGDVHLYWEDDGFRLEWISEKVMGAHVKHFDLQGNPKGEAYKPTVEP